eukprot:m51a1_g9040 hypothetical protein (133) ;mRNA; r:2208-2725
MGQRFCSCCCAEEDHTLERPYVYRDQRLFDDDDWSHGERLDENTRSLYTPPSLVLPDESSDEPDALKPQGVAPEPAPLASQHQSQAPQQQQQEEEAQAAQQPLVDVSGSAMGSTLYYDAPEPSASMLPPSSS